MAVVASAGREVIAIVAASIPAQRVFNTGNTPFTDGVSWQAGAADECAK
jgi:hypothetical protein